MGAQTVVSCYDRALRLLGQRPHFEAELVRKLQRRDYPSDQIGVTMDRLRDGGYVDDAATADLFVQQRRSRRHEGWARLLAELLKRGVDRQVAEAALASCDETELEVARRALGSLVGQLDDDQKARRLERKGFRGDVIVTVLNEMRAG